MNARWSVTFLLLLFGLQAFAYLEDSASNADVNRLRTVIALPPLPAMIESCESSVDLDATTANAMSYTWELDTGTGFMPQPAFDNNPILTAGTSGTYRVTIALNDGTIITDQSDVIIYERPVLTNPGTQTACDEVFLPAITGTNLSGSEAYYATNPTADPSAIPLDPAIPITTSQTIFIYDVVGNTTPACEAVQNFQVIVTETPQHASITDINECGSAILPEIFDVADGTTVRPRARFFLTTDGTGISYAQDQTIRYTDFAPSDFPVTFFTYETTGAPNNCTNPINSFELNLTPAPEAADGPLRIEACNSNNNPATAFDLTDVEAAALGTLPSTSFIVTYYPSPDDAINETNEIGTPNSFSTNATSAYARVTDTSTSLDCFDIVRINLIVTPPPTIAMIPPFSVCDDDGTDDGVTNFDLTTLNDDLNPDTTSHTYTYHLTNTGAVTGDMSIPDPTMHVSADDRIFVRVELIADGCFNTDPIDLVVLSSFTTMPPTDYNECDMDNDGFTNFQLNTKTDEITGSDPSLTVAYYEDEMEANAPTGGLELDQLNFTNTTVNNQTIWARVENAGGCFNVVPLNIIVFETALPELNPDPYGICDINGDGSEIFDLRTRENEILNGLDPLQYTIVWFNTLPEAEAGTPAVATPNSYPVNMPTATVYAVVTEEGQSTEIRCPSIPVALELQVNPLPVAIVPMPYELCDDDNDGTSDFVLSSLDSEISGGNTDLLVSYFINLVTAGMPGGTALPDDFTSSSRTIGARVTNINTGCFTTVPVDLVAVPSPTPMMIPPVESCALVGEVTADFNLTIPSILNTIANGEPVDITFHESETEAIAGTPQITNTTAYNTETTTIWVRSTENDPATSTACFTVISIELVVNPIPEIPDDLEELVTCVPDLSAGATFNLTEREDAVYGSQARADFTISYHESMISAETSTVAGIANPTNYMTLMGREIWVRLENNDTGCFSVDSFMITIGEIPTANLPETLRVCDTLESGDNTDGITTFNLSDLEAGITGNDTSLTVLFYEGLANFNAGQAIVDPSNYASNGSLPIYFTVENVAMNCMSSPQQFAVVVTPTPFTDLSDTGGVICVDRETGMELNPVSVDATPENVVTNATYLYRWTLDNNPAVIATTPTLAVTASGTYNVTIEAVYEDATGTEVARCSYSTQTTFMFESAPIFTVSVLEDSFTPSGVYTVVIDPASIMGVGTTQYEFSIDNGPYQTDLTFENVSPGVHTVFGRSDENGCAPTEVTVRILDYPRFFTPNNDGFHDTWSIFSASEILNQQAKILIFDRYGKLLKQLGPLDPGWDGTIRGQPVPSTDYWFKVEYTETDDSGDLVRREFKGHFTLKR